MLAYIPYMDPMGYPISTHVQISPVYDVCTKHRDLCLAVHGCVYLQ
jgi:hypothetical protein